MLDRRRVLKGGAAAVAAAPVAVAAPVVGACPARYVGVPPTVVCMGDLWVDQWLSADDVETKGFLETVCNGLAFRPSEERKSHLDDLLIRARRIVDEREDEAIRSETPIELIREGEAMTMAVNLLDESGGMAALNYALKSLHVVRRRWGEEEFANGNLNALVLSLSLVGVLLTGLGHPDFADGSTATPEGGEA